MNILKFGYINFLIFIRESYKRQQ